MSDWLTFDGRITVMEWGKSVYTVLPIPADIAKALDTADARRVEGEIADHSFNLALTKAPVIEGPFLYTSKDFLKGAGIAPGDDVHVRLRPADPDHVEVPDALQTALRGADLTADWNDLPAGCRRSMLQPVLRAKRPDTQAKKIADLLAALAGQRGSSDAS